MTRTVRQATPEECKKMNDAFKKMRDDMRELEDLLSEVMPPAKWVVITEDSEVMRVACIISGRVSKMLKNFWVNLPQF